MASLIHGFVDAITGNQHAGKVKVTATVVLMKKNVLDFNDVSATVLDSVSEFLGQGVSLQLVSSTVGDPNLGNRGKVGEVAYLEQWLTNLIVIAASELKFSATFYWDASFGVPGAVIVKNKHAEEFFLKSISLENFPGKNQIHFMCSSWVYPAWTYNYDRIFFANDTYLPGETPAALKPYREQELLHLKGDNVTGQLQDHDRVYGYAYYNDLGAPDSGANFARPILGGSKELPYPRRGRTGRPPTRTDPNTESRLTMLIQENYVPRDERFGHIKRSDFLGYAIKSIVQSLVPALRTFVDLSPMEFDSFQDMLWLMYEGGLKLPQIPVLDEIKNQIPFEMVKELLSTDGARLLKFPIPQVIQEDKVAWRTDEEFGREMLSGVNPVIISLLQVFPPTSKLDPQRYGDHTSKITATHIEKNMEGLTIDQALMNNRLFIMDHHDTLIPYVNRINSTPGSKIYASRTMLLLKDDGTLKPLAIELSLPHPDGEKFGAISRVFTPADQQGVEDSIWQLAKAYATVNDAGVHQLISHWLHTHAVLEPFVIATNRQLSAMHPVHKLLNPHYRDTMNINALARQVLVSADGLIEKTVFPGKYAMELSSVIYKDWKLTEQGLPADLIKRGVAVQDSTKPNNIRLLIQDYPFAVDGLAIWSAIQTWVEDYCSIYYPTDAVLQADTEIQAWWKEVREVGHGDKKDETWWPQMAKVSDLTYVCTTIIWIASALHAAVNFGQYAYTGYHPNRPTMSRRFMPEPGTPEYEELKKNPDRIFLRTITSQLNTIIGVSLIEILSRHSSDEVYLGQRDTAVWTSDEKALAAFKRFGDKLVEIENKIIAMNGDKSLKNRNGPAKVPYTLLYPNTSDHSGVGGITGKGVPNSISI